MKAMTPKAITPPLPCYGVEHDASCEICQQCQHAPGCRELMGDRLERVTLDHARFSLVPDAFHHRTMKVTEAERDLPAFYAQTYAQVFGCPPAGSIGWDGPKLIELAEEAGCSAKMFIFTCMFGHLQQREGPHDFFTPGQLVDGRALQRVNTYAKACRTKYAAFNVNAIDQLAKTHNAACDLNARMLRSEIKAGRWIIRFKLRHDGAPYAPALEALEDELDPDWLAIEPHYTETLLAYSRREDDGSHQRTRNAALERYGRIKKHRHEALASFLARERAMPEAIDLVLAEISYAPQDFEIRDPPVTETLRFWYRLALAIQHMECVKLLHFGTGIYAKTLTPAT